MVLASVALPMVALINDVPLLIPSTVVVTVPVDEVTAVVGLTVAMPVEDDQVMVRPASGNPAASLSTAVAVVVLVF